MELSFHAKHGLQLSSTRTQLELVGIILMLNLGAHSGSSANALVGGWGNMGGGITFIIMVALYNRLVEHLTPHKAWRVAFAIVPVPCLILVAILVLVFGTDHPAGKWSQRHDIPAAKFPHRDHTVISDEFAEFKKKESDSDDGAIIEEKEIASGVVTPNHAAARSQTKIESELDIAINEVLTMKGVFMVVSSSLTWLPALAYATTFGYELAIDANLANVLFGLFPHLGQTKAGYVSAHSLFNFILSRRM